MVQTEITEPGPVHNPDGTLAAPGYSKRMIRSYSRSSVRSPAFHLKEWDYYCITDGIRGVALTVADNGYMGLVSASFLNFADGSPEERTKSIIKPFTFGKFRMPESTAVSSSLVRYADSKCEFAFETVLEEAASHGSVPGGADSDLSGRFTPRRRRLSCRMEDFSGGKPFAAEILLLDEPAESMVISTPFPGNPRAFFYNQKINCMPASGFAECGGDRHEFKSESAFAVLDWGRGVWTYDNTWYWASASGLSGGKRFGFNLGYGFGDTSAASENMLFYDGESHKLDQVSFHIPESSPGECDWTGEWLFTSNDGRLELSFRPVIDRAARLDALVLLSDQHQVFGRFSGTAALDDGTRLEIRDLFGFAEKVRNKW